MFLPERNQRETRERTCQPKTCNGSATIEGIKN